MNCKCGSNDCGVLDAALPARRVVFLELFLPLGRIHEWLNLCVWSNVLQVTVHRKNQGMLLFPAFLTWNCCACAASGWRTVRVGSEQQQKHTQKPTKSNTKRVRQRKQINSWKIDSPSWIGPCTESSSLPRQHQLEGRSGLLTGVCYRDNVFTMRNKHICSVVLAVKVISSAYFYKLILSWKTNISCYDGQIPRSSGNWWFLVFLSSWLDCFCGVTQDVKWPHLKPREIFISCAIDYIQGTF